MKNKKVFLILGIGAIGLYVFYRYRSGQSIIPGFGGGALAGQGTVGSNTPNGGFIGSGSTNLPTVPAQSMSESERIRLRNAATGPESRGQCLIANGCRWIDTQTPPFYGVRVNQATFTRWMNGGFTFPGSDTNQPTLDFVKRALGI